MNVKHVLDIQNERYFGHIVIIQNIPLFFLCLIRSGRCFFGIDFPLKQLVLNALVIGKIIDNLPCRDYLHLFAVKMSHKLLNVNKQRKETHILYENKSIENNGMLVFAKLPCGIKSDRLYLGIFL